MKLGRRIAALLLILAAVLVAVRAAWTIGRGVDNAKEFFYGFIGKDVDTPSEDSYSNEDGYITETKLIPVRGVDTVSLEVDAAQIKLKVGGGSDIVVEAAYNEKNFVVDNAFSAVRSNGTATISLKLKTLNFTIGKSVRRSVLTVTIPEKFKGSLNLHFNACVFDGDSGNASSISLNANAVKLELRGISGSLSAKINAGDSEFYVRGAAGDINITSSACATKINLPAKSNFKVSPKMNAGTCKNNYDDKVERKGKEYALNLTGNAAAFTVDVTD
ncbi:MAG: hypothetical protein LBJ12_09360 [Oscillospiraceae bacterium]|jgi:hypothetical protein|nr:hypothetical protein [Oscillospiraceae bacterium]